jgi:hypothetical protein
MKNLGLILGSLAIAGGTMYAVRRYFTSKAKSTLNKNKNEGKLAHEKNGDNEELHSSISKSYVFVADYVI